MPYITSETVKLIRSEIKKAYPNFKFSITRRDCVAINVVVLRGDIDFKVISTQTNGGFTRTEDDASGKKMIEDVNAVIDSVEPEKEVCFDGDYGSVPNYYKSISIGDYDRPYQFIDKLKAA